MLKLGVNIDHVATVREARRVDYPDPVEAALAAERAGAEAITFHLREDRRHIQDHDLLRLRQEIHVRLNQELAPTEEMVELALKIRPHEVCLVPGIGTYFARCKRSPFADTTEDGVTNDLPVGADP